MTLSRQFSFILLQCTEFFFSFRKREGIVSEEQNNVGEGYIYISCDTGGCSTKMRLSITLKPYIVFNISFRDLELVVRTVISKDSYLGVTYINKYIFNIDI